MDNLEQSSNQPLISIVVPVYNSEKHLRQCVDSLLSQTYENWELLLINDGSKDKSGEICDYYTNLDCRIRAIHKSNGGVSSARNIGIKEAHGKFIAFIDSDDFVKKDYIYEFIKCNPAIKSLTITGVISKNLTEEYLSYSYPNKISINKDKASNIIIKYDLFKDGGPTNKLFDRELIIANDLLFREDLNYHEDHIFVYQYYLLCDTLNFSNYNGYYYMYYGTDSNNSLSRRGKKKISPLLLASEVFLNLLPLVFQHFLITDQNYIDKVLTRNGYSQIILAIYNAYKYRETDMNPKNLLIKYQPVIKSFTDRYTPLTFKRHLFLRIIQLPIPIADFILRKLI